MARRPPATNPHAQPNLFDLLEDRDFENAAALLDAGARYGGDAARELADLQARRHPLQRPRAQRE